MTAALLPVSLLSIAPSEVNRLRNPPLPSVRVNMATLILKNGLGVFYSHVFDKIWTILLKEGAFVSCDFVRYGIMRNSAEAPVF